MVDEMFRVLKGGGRIVIDVSNKDCLYYGSFGAIIRALFPHLPSLMEPEVRKYSARELRRLLGTAGFTDAHIRYLLLPHRRFPKWLVTAIGLLAPLFEHGPLKRFSGILLAAANKP